MYVKLLFLAVTFWINCASADISAKQYASLPEVFHLDNFDRCMMYEDEAFFCSFIYVLSPIDPNNVSDTWLLLQNVTSKEFNYRHHHIRHWICTPKTCPNVQKTMDNNDPALKRQLEECYDKKYVHLGLKGTITRLHCEGEEPIYDIDWLDITFGFSIALYIGFILFATFYDAIISGKPKEEYEKVMQVKKNKILTTFSLTRSWIKLKTVNMTPDLEKLRCIQGIRVYNIALVVLCHTVLTYLVGPVTNTTYSEQLNDGNAVMIFSTGPLCVGSNFFIASFLLSQGLFEYLKDKKGMNLKIFSFAFISRLFRLLPSLIVMILFHATWLRHLGRGPIWEKTMSTEFEKCRTNGWTNVLFLNNLIGRNFMCAAETWYLAVDTQLFVLGLLFIWVLKKYQNHVWSIIAGSLSISCFLTFLQNYYHGYPALIMSGAEQNYELELTLSNEQFMVQTIGVLGNTTSSITGIAFGYAYYKTKNRKIFTTTFRICLFWAFSFGFAFAYLLVTGLIIFKWSKEPNIFWASVYNAVSRPITAFCVGLSILGFKEGVGWIALRIVQWPPTYILGRLTFSVYLVHVPLAYYRFALTRTEVYLHEYLMMLTFLGDFTLSCILGTLLTLFVEMPVSELQKYLFTKPELVQPVHPKESKDK